MTCIVSVEHSGGVMIGSDSAVSSDEWLEEIDHSKVNRAGSIVIGMAGAIRYSNTLSEIEPSKAKRRKGESDIAYIKRVWVKRAREALDAMPGPNEFDFCAILAHGGRAFYLSPDLAVMRSKSAYFAIGSGSPYAFGSLATTKDWKSTYARVHAALSAAETHCPSVRAPFHIINVDAHGDCKAVTA